MRRNFIASLESRTDGVVLSLEEEAVIIAEAGEDLGEAIVEQGDIERNDDISAALEDLAEVADSIEEATPTDLAMVDTAIAAATAGSDVDVEEIAPALESYIGRRISTEGIRDSARRLWESILAAIKKIWAKIENFFHKIVGTIPRLRKEAAAMKARAESFNSMTVENNKTSLGAETRQLAIDKVKPTAAKDLIKAMEVLVKQGKVVFSAYPNKMSAAGDAMADAISDFNADTPAKAEASLLSVVKAAGKFNIGDLEQLCSAVKTKDSRWKSGEASMAPSLPGAKSLVFLADPAVRSGTPPAGMTPLELAETVRRISCQLVPTNTGDKESPSECEIVTMSTSNVGDICDLIGEICDQIEEYQRGKGSKEIAKTSEKMKTASAKAAGAMEKGRKDSTPAVTSLYKSAINFNITFSRWATTPMGSLAAQSLATSRAMLIACSKSLANYKAI